MAVVDVFSRSFRPASHLSCVLLSACVCVRMYVCVSACACFFFSSLYISEEITDDNELELETFRTMQTSIKPGDVH